MYAVDRDSGQVLTQEQAIKAADNPCIYTWVVWVDDPDQVEPSNAPRFH